MKVDKREFVGIPFVRTTLSDATAMVCKAAVTGRDGDVHLLNAYSIALADADPTLTECYKRATWNFPDGKPLSVLTKYSREPLSQVRGPSLFESVMDQGRRNGLRHFLLGSTPEILSTLQASLEQRYPGVNIVGAISPPFRAMSPQEVANQDASVLRASPDIVWVGLGTPKQDFETQRLARECQVLAIAVGAAFDFSAGATREAPRWMTRYGLEWAFRFASEPKRLWRRYVFGNARFLFAFARSAK